MKETIQREIANLKAHWALMPLWLKIAAPTFAAGVTVAILVSIVHKL